MRLRVNKPAPVTSTSVIATWPATSAVRGARRVTRGVASARDWTGERTAVADADEAREQRDAGRGCERGTGHREPRAGRERELEPLDVDASRELESPNAIKEPERDGHREHRAERAEDRRLDGDARGEPAACRTEREADGQLVAAILRAHQQQHADGETADQQQQADGDRQQRRELRRAGAGKLGHSGGVDVRETERPDLALRQRLASHMQSNALSRAAAAAGVSPGRKRPTMRIQAEPAPNGSPVAAKTS